MHIVSVYNRYQQRGGEGEVFEAEAKLLERHGCKVTLVEEPASDPRGIREKIELARNVVWSPTWHAEFRGLLKSVRPDVVHVHNFFPAISPAIYYACREHRVPVVQSLHNPRLLCPAATSYREGRACEDCLGKAVPWPAVLHGCYHSSRVQSAVVAAMLSVHRALGTWEQQVDGYIVFTDFYRRKFVQGGLPPEKIAVKPHFVDPDPGRKCGIGNYIVFIGRLAPEKGVHTLLAAWERLKEVPLKIRGDGPLLDRVKQLASQENQSVEVVPRLTRERLVTLLKGARLLVLPSEGHYETFGLVAAEAFACGVPVLASRCGVMEEMVEEGKTGLYFEPGDPDDLAAKVEWAWTHPQRLEEMGREARLEYEAKYTAARNYRMLMEIYEQMIQMRKVA